MRALAWIASGVGIVWLCMSLTYPFGWDQGILAWVGGVVVNGGLPYVDAWDMKGPLVYYTFALAQVLFGVHLWSVRILDALLLVGATVSLRGAATALTDRITGLWAGLIFLLWYASHSYWHTAQPDGWTAMLLIIALGPLLSGTHGLSGAAVVRSGLLLGLTTLLKPLWAVLLLLPLLPVILEPSARRIRLAAILIGAWLLPIVLMAIWFVAHGALGELIAVHLTYSAVYAGLSPGGRARGLVEYFLSSRVIAVGLPLVVFGVVVLWRRRRPAAIVLAVWIVLVVLATALQNRFFAYQWLPILPAATLLWSVGLHEVRSRLPVLANVLCMVILAQCLAPVAYEELRFVSWMAGRMSTDTYYDAYGEPGSDMKAVRWLRSEGTPGSIFVFGWHGTVAWLSERHVVSRFGFSMPLMIGDGLEIRAAYRREAMAALAATPPQYILVGKQPDRIIGTHMTVADFPELEALLATAYRPAVQFGPITLYGRRP